MYYRFILSFGHSDTMYDSNKKHVRVVLIGRDTLSEDNFVSNSAVMPSTYHTEIWRDLAIE